MAEEKTVLDFPKIAKDVVGPHPFTQFLTVCDTENLTKQEAAQLALEVTRILHSRGNSLSNYDE